MGQVRPPHHGANGRFRNPWPGSVEHGFGSALRWMFERAPLGVARQLRERGVRNVMERDWRESAEPLPGVRVTCEPTRHFSGRSTAKGT